MPRDLVGRVYLATRQTSGVEKGLSEFWIYKYDDDSLSIG